MYLIKERFFDIGDDYDITNDDGRAVLHVDGKVLSLRDRLVLKEKFTIDVPGPDDLEMKGNLLDHEFVVERGGHEVASVSKRWFTLRDTYGVNIADGEDHLLILCGVLALDLAMAREDEKKEE